MGKREMEDVLPGKQAFKLTIFGTVAGFVLSMMFLALAALAVTNGLFSQKQMYALALISAFLGVFFSSLRFSRRHKGNKWMMGAAIGFSVFFLYFIIGLFAFFPPRGSQILQIMATTVLSGLLAGLLVGRKKHKRKH